MAFKKRRGIKLTYEQQGYIAFTCYTYTERSEETQRKILNLCLFVGGEYHAALFDVMTRSDMSVTQVAMKHHVSEQLIYNLRRKFYESWE